MRCSRCTTPVDDICLAVVEDTPLRPWSRAEAPRMRCERVRSERHDGRTRHRFATAEAGHGHSIRAIASTSTIA